MELFIAAREPFNHNSDIAWKQLSDEELSIRIPAIGT
jgi:hypothetical protein